MSSGGNICLTCGGLIMAPGVAYGYSGPTCQCLVPPKIQVPMNGTFNFGQIKTTVTPLPKEVESEGEQLIRALAEKNALAKELEAIKAERDLCKAEVEQLKAEIAKFPGLQDRRIKNCVKGYNEKVEENKQLRAEVERISQFSREEGARLFDCERERDELRSWCAKLEAALEDYWGKDSGHPVLTAYRAWRDGK